MKTQICTFLLLHRSPAHFHPGAWGAYPRHPGCAGRAQKPREESQGQNDPVSIPSRRDRFNPLLLRCVSSSRGARRRPRADRWEAHFPCNAYGQIGRAEEGRGGIFPLSAATAAVAGVFLVRGRSWLPPPKPPTRGSSSEPPPPLHCKSGGVGGNSVPKAQRRGAQREGEARSEEEGARAEELRRTDGRAKSKPPGWTGAIGASGAARADASHS